MTDCLRLLLRATGPGLCAAGLLAAVAPALAQTPRAPEPVVQPQVERRELKPASYPSRDFAIGLFGGSYATQNFGTNGVGGLRLGYHITEDFFVDITVARTKVSDEAFRQVLPGGIFATAEQTLEYYAISAGWNLISGEAFFGRRTAMPLQVYLVAGAGSTDFAGQRKQTVHAGLGLRVNLSSRFAVQADVRNHSFALDLLGRRETTQNPEITLGLTAYF
jgi:outer membrane beta-barrel protein